jgi:DDE superfamily endonuclease
LVTAQQKIIYLSQTYEGKVHDKKITDQEPLTFEQSVELLQDSGFKGHNPKNAIIKEPHKNSKLKRLTEVQKIENTLQASQRVKVEHAICGTKRLRIVKDVYRNKRETIDIAMTIACGLHNLRIAA